MIKLLTLAMLLAAAVALMALAACDGGRSTAEPTGPPTAGPTGGPSSASDWRAYPTADWRGHSNSTSWDHQAR